MEKQIKEQFHAAFYDVIRDSIVNNDFDHVVRLYKEIQDRLAKMLRKDGPSYNKLHEDFDVPFFEQRLRHNAFDGTSMASLVHTTFAWVHNLQMPIRDSSTREAKQRVLEVAGSMADIVPVYIKEVHGCIDIMEQDMKEFYENRDHPVVKEMLRQAMTKK